MKNDPVNNPSHYALHTMQCIDVVKYLPFNVGNAIKYMWRHQHKNNPVEDLKKALWYVVKEQEMFYSEESQPINIRDFDIDQQQLWGVLDTLPVNVVMGIRWLTSIGQVSKSMDKWEHSLKMAVLSLEHEIDRITIKKG